MLKNEEYLLLIKKYFLDLYGIKVRGILFQNGIA